MFRVSILIAGAVAVTALSAAEEVPRNRVEQVSAGRHEFTIRMGGTVDGVNTRDPITYSAWRQAFEPMRSVRIENAGETEVVNPWVNVNGKRNWRTVKDIAEEAMRSYGDPAKMSAAERARAIWDFQRRHRFHATTGDFEVRDPVKMYNVYGFSLCGDNAPVLSDVWRAAGFQTRRGFPIGHCVSEVWYDGSWHMFDADESVIFLDRDNRTVLPDKEVARDHELARRGYPNPMLASLYPYDGQHAGDYPSHAGHEMNLTLRPGEALEWGWAHSGKHHHAPPPTLYTLRSTVLSQWGEDAWARLSNGKLIYTPDLRKPAGRKFVLAQNVKWGAGARDAAASQAQSGAPATLTWEMRAPYVIVGGRLKARVRGSGAFAVRISPDGESWSEAVPVEGAGTREVDESLDKFFPGTGSAVYRYFVRVELKGTGLDSIAISNDLQMAPLSLPALELGDNRVVYSDETKGPRAVRVAFDWVERSSMTPPAAPETPRFPADKADVDGTRFTFLWPQMPGISDYHFQLSEDPSFRWAITPAFDVMIPEKPQFELNREGMLNPGQRYFWRVRARSAEGVWSQWSPVWTFVPHAPGTPAEVKLVESEPGGFTLQWKASGSDRTPVSFRVYASDEKGFPASDEPYRAPTGNQKQRGLFPGEKTRMFPANFLGETKETTFRLGRPRHAFYRVVAVDAKGNRSGSSGYDSAPRPYIFTVPPAAEVKVGTPFRYDVKTIASIGDLTYRDFGPGQAYQAAYWDAEKPVFSLEVELPRCGNFDPKWLGIDPKTGVLSGTPGPADVFEYQVNVKVQIPNVGAYVQSFPLRVVK